MYAVEVGSECEKAADGRADGTTPALRRLEPDTQTHGRFKEAQQQARFPTPAHCTHCATSSCLTPYNHFE